MRQKRLPDKRIKRPVLPFPGLRPAHRIGDLADQIGRDRDAIELVQVRLDLTKRKPAGIEAEWIRSSKPLIRVRPLATICG